MADKELMEMMKKLVVMSLMASMALGIFSGCDATTASAPGNATLGGAAAGGLGGAALGAMVNKSNPGTGALVGGALGAVGGGLVGNQMERNRDRAYSQQQQAYDAGYHDGAGAPPPPPPPARSY